MFGSMATRSLILAAILLLLSGCSSLRTSTPFPSGQHIFIENKLPDELPARSSRFPGSQFVLVPQDSAIDMLVPVPFVTDLVLDSVHAHQAESLAQRYARIDPYKIVQKAMSDSSLIDPNGIRTQPFAYLIDCKDDRYRMALVARMREKEWVGRYVVHLPSTFTPDEISTAKQETIDEMGQQLNEAAAILRRMIEEDARGKLTAPLYHANIGSFNLACSDVGGLLPAKLLLLRNAVVVEDDDEHLIVRGTGDMNQSGAGGGLLFGLHYLRKNQLHTFDRLPGK